MVKMSTHEAEVLLKGARRLDRTVLTRVFDTFYTDIYSYIVFRIGDPQLSAQISGQVFSVLLDNLSKYGEPARNLTGWLYQTANSLVQDYLINIVFEAASGETIPQEETPERLFQYRLQAIFQKLPPEHQHFLALRFSGQRSMDELSQILDKPAKSIRESQFQALKTFQQALQARVK